MRRIRRRMDEGTKSQNGLVVRWSALLSMVTVMATMSSSVSFRPLLPLRRKLGQSNGRKVLSLCMVMANPAPKKERLRQQLEKERAAAAAASTQTKKVGELPASAQQDNQKRKVRRKYKRRQIPESEKELKNLRRERQAEYERIMSKAGESSPSIWSFESLFPEPVLDKQQIFRDLYEIRDRDKAMGENATASSDEISASESRKLSKMKSSFYGGSSMMRIWREPKASSAFLPHIIPETLAGPTYNMSSASQALLNNKELIASPEQNDSNDLVGPFPTNGVSTPNVTTLMIDRDLTRMVEDRMFGYRRTQSGDFQYDTSLMGDGAVKFREGVRLGNPLPVNAERLNYFAKKEMQHGRIEEAMELYEHAIKIDPRDGRAYLGLSNCAQRRGDLKLSREWLQRGIGNSVSVGSSMRPDRGANPFLLQALGCLEEKMGNLPQAESLYLAAARSRPSHAAAWVSLGQLRSRKLGQGASAGRICFQTAERELKEAGMPQSAHVYTAWAALEYRQASDIKRARELFQLALDIDPKCSAAWLQLGVMEGECENWDEAKHAFDTVLKYDGRNSRVLQAYALMESKRPDGSSRKAIGLFERALKASPRDAGTLQAYALYVAKLGDVDAARNLLRRGTEANKRHPAVWQGWGVLETRAGNPEEARRIFQQGIWSCAQATGGQSGGYACARLWQAWGVLEAEQGDIAAARRCFNRALDAHSRNLPAIIAWANMEERSGNIADARAIYEVALRKFSPGSDEKTALWRNYELMEQRLGNVAATQQVYQRSMRDAFAVRDDQFDDSEFEIRRKAKGSNHSKQATKTAPEMKKNQEVEVSSWEGGGGEIWLNDRAIEAKVPFDMKRRKKSNK